MIPTELAALSAPAPFDVGVVLLVLAAVVLFAAAARLVVIRVRWSGESRERELPPLVYPAPAARRPEPARSEARSQAGDDVTFNSTAPAVRILRESGNGPAPGVPGIDRANDGAAAAGADADATLQLLPGRLEPMHAGADQEIRFVKVAGVTRFTLGRKADPAHNHIQLRSATASRLHAYMVYEAGRWHLGNMSSTNHVIVNGSPLTGDAPRVLEDGDRIEFGELTFVFRER